MANNNNNVWMIVGICFVVAIITSVVTANITGNAIITGKSITGIRDQVTYQGVLNMLKNFNVRGNTDSNISCDAFCKSYGETATREYIMISYKYKDNSTDAFVFTWAPSYNTGANPITAKEAIASITDNTATLIAYSSACECYSTKATHPSVSASHKYMIPRA